MRRSTGASSSSGSQPCAACRYQRKKCPPDCALAPYFPAERMDDFNNARKLFGISKMIKQIESVEADLRADCVKSMVFEANMRAAYPVGGCHQYTLELQQRIYWTELELKHMKDRLAFCKAQTQAAQQQYLRQNQMVQAVDGHVQGQVNAFNEQSLEGFNMYNSQAQAQATQHQYLVQNQMVEAVGGHVQGQVNAFNDQSSEGFYKSNAQALSTQQRYSGQNQMVQANAFNDQSLEGFNMYNNSLPDHFQQYQEEACNVFQGSYGGSSPSSTVYNVFDSNLVNVQSEEPVVDDDIMPLLDMFDGFQREVGAFPFDSNGSNSQSGDQLVSEQELRSTQPDELQHDLKDAASLLTLRNTISDK